MQRSFRLILLAFALALATCALAIFPSMSNVLIGTPTNGAIPSGDIKLNQSKLPRSPASIQIRLKSVNLPNGTILGVTIGGLFYGNVTVSNGQVNGSISTFEQTGRNADVAITQSNGALVAGQTAAWKT